MADVYEQDLSWINEGSAATISLPYDAGRTVEATVDYLYDEVDETTRTVKARLSVPNGDRSLRPGMYAVVEIRGAAAEPRPVVPQEAIVSSGDLDVVIVAEGDGRFRPTPVHTGRSASGQTQILHGLTGGERVVTSAQFLIDSEARLQGALTAMTESVDGESMSGGMDAAGMEMDASPDQAPDEASEPSHGTAHDHGSGAEATAEGPAQGDATDGRIEITVTEQGFQPSHVHVAQGVETELVFTRKTTSTCATNVQIPALGVDPVELPMNEAVTIRVTPQKTGSFTFACGMDMIKGTLMIQQ
jgi:plastocyanin